MAVAMLVPTASARADCYQQQIDYDFVFGNLEDIIVRQLPNWTAASAWDDVLYQLGPGFEDLDNDANGIDDDDHFDLLAAVVNGTGSSLAGVPQGNIDSVRNAFNFNAAKIQQIQFTIPGVKVRLSNCGGFTVYDGSVTTGSSLTVYGQKIDIPSLWVLLNDESPLLKEALVNLVAGYMTVGDTSSVQHLQSLLGVIVQRFIADVLPSLISRADGTETEVGTRGCSPNIAITVPVDVVGNVCVQISGCNVDTGVNNFIGRLNCSEFQCRSSIIGAGGNLNGTGSTNLGSYEAAGGIAKA